MHHFLCDSKSASSLIPTATSGVGRGRFDCGGPRLLRGERRRRHHRHGDRISVKIKNVSNCLTANPPPCVWLSRRVAPEPYSRVFRPTASDGRLAVSQLGHFVVAWKCSRTVPTPFLRHDFTARCNAAMCSPNGLYFPSGEQKMI